MSEHFVGPWDAVPEGAFLLVDVSGTEVGVARIGDRLIAFENRCPHQLGPACQGEIIGRREAVLDADHRLVDERFSEEHFDVVCPWHGFSFDSETGQNICDHRMRLRKWEVLVRDNEVFVRRP